MDAAQRDITDEWKLPRGRGTMLLEEIESRVEEAVVIARTCEEGVREIGGIAVDSAERARRAAEMAEAASRAAAEARDAARMPAPAGGGKKAGATTEQTSRPRHIPAPTGETRLRRFTERCDRVSARLRALERRPGAPEGAAGVEARRRGGG